MDDLSRLWQQDFLPLRKARRHDKGKMGSKGGPMLTNVQKVKNRYSQNVKTCTKLGEMILIRMKNQGPTFSPLCKKHIKVI